MCDRKEKHTNSLVKQIRTTKLKRKHTFWMFKTKRIITNLILINGTERNEMNWIAKKRVNENGKKREKKENHEHRMSNKKHICKTIYLVQRSCNPINEIIVELIIMVIILTRKRNGENEI